MKPLSMERIGHPEGAVYDMSITMDAGTLEPMITLRHGILVWGMKTHRSHSQPCEYDDPLSKGFSRKNMAYMGLAA